MQFEIPVRDSLPPLISDSAKPDINVSIVQLAWCDVINLVYREAKDSRSHMRLTMELRSMGGSDMPMVPQQGNDLRIASIEVLTILVAVPEQCKDLKQKITDI